MRTRICVHRAARVDDTDEDIEHYLTCGQIPRFGFCWWFWIPYIKAARMGGDGFDVTVFWLCWFVSVYREGSGR